MRKRNRVRLPPVIRAMGPKALKDVKKGVMIEFERQQEEITGPMSCITYFLPSLFFCLPCYERYSRSIERRDNIGVWVMVPLDVKQTCAACKQKITKQAEGK